VNLERTKQLILGEVNREDPIASLIHVLESAVELLSLPENDFSWSHWKDAKEAIAEIDSLRKAISNGSLPERLTIAGLFAPTGSLQEVSLSSAWGEALLRVAAKFDEVEKLIWNDG
jgi:hypothetical protein